MINLDFETYSEAGYRLGKKVKGLGKQGKGGLPAVGTAAYAEHPSTDILSLAYSINGCEPRLWFPGMPPPNDLFDAIHSGMRLSAWNFTFEFFIWMWVAVRKYGWPAIALENGSCQMAASRRYSFPGSLSEAAKVAGTAEKDHDGKNVMLRLSRPLTPTKDRPGYQMTPANSWAQFLKLYAYNIQDVIAEMATGERIPPLSPQEQEIWFYDQMINTRGVQVDVEALDAALIVLEQTERAYTLALQDLTDRAVMSVGEVENMKTWICDQGYVIDNLKAGTVKEALADSLPDNVRDVLLIRQAIGSLNVKKLRMLKMQISRDGRLRCQYSYCGADRTGRWCLSGDHEVLTVAGWQRLDEWLGGPIACWREDGNIFFDTAQPNTFAYSGDMHLWEGRRFQQLATPEHKMPAVTKTGEFKAVEVKDCITTLRHPRSGYLAPSSRYTDNELRFFVMVQADGCITNKAVRLKFRKKRKADRCRSILRVLNIQHRERVNGDGSTSFDAAYGFIPKDLLVYDSDKTFPPELLICDHDLFFEELAFWDSSASSNNSLQYVTTNKRNADLVQAKAHLSGRSCNIKEKHRDRQGWSVAYCCHVWFAYKATHGSSIKKSLEKFSGQVYCPSTSTGFFLVRRNGVAWITGNSSGGVQLQNLSNSGPVVSKCKSCGHYFGAMTKHPGCPVCKNLVDFDDTVEWCPEAAEQAIDDFTANPSFTALQERWGGVIKTLTGCIRGLFVAKPGHRLIIVDFSSIEAVVLACLSRCQWRIDVFKDHGKIYEMSAAAITGKTFEFYMDYKRKTGNHHPDRKKIGKVAELASGYAGWLPAWRQFGAEGEDWEIKQQILAWRAASPEIVQFWGGQYIWCGPGKWDYTPHLHGLEGMAIMAILNPGQIYTVGDLAFKMADDCLKMRLPSGRCLHYHRPRLSNGKDPLKRGPCYKITYEGWNSNPTKGPVGWHRMDTYGGRFAENATQAVARDIQAEAVIRCEKAFYPVVMHTHDEIVAEVPEEFDDWRPMSDLMIQRPVWANWWPIRAAGFSSYRYGKD